MRPYGTGRAGIEPVTSEPDDEQLTDPLRLAHAGKDPGRAGPAPARLRRVRDPRRAAVPGRGPGMSGADRRMRGLGQAIGGARAAREGSGEREQHAHRDRLAESHRVIVVAFSDEGPQPRGISREESAAGYRPPRYRPQPMN